MKSGANDQVPVDEVIGQLKDFADSNPEFRACASLLLERLEDYHDKLSQVIEENEVINQRLFEKEKAIVSLQKDQTGHFAHNKELMKIIDLKEKALDEALRKIEDLESNITLKDDMYDHEMAKKGEDQWKIKYEELEEKTQKLLQDIETQFRERLEAEREEYKNRTNENLHNRNLELEQQVIDDKARITLLMMENERLNTEINKTRMEASRVMVQALQSDPNERAKRASRGSSKVFGDDDELLTLRSKVATLQFEKVLQSAEIERLQIEKQDLLGEIAIYTAAYNKFKLELEEYKKRIGEQDKFNPILEALKQQTNDQEKRINLLLDENSKLTELASKRLEELVELKRQSYRSSEPVQQTISPSDLKEMIFQFDQERKAWEIQMKESSFAIEILRNENQKLKNILNLKKQENQELINENDKLKIATAANQDLADNLQLLTAQYNQTMKELDQLKVSRDFYKQQFASLQTNNIQALNDMVRESVKYIDTNPNLE